MSILNNGEATALAAMIIEVPPESIVGFTLVAIVQPEEIDGCTCGRPEDHRRPHIISTEEDQLLAVGMLSEGITQVVSLEAHAKYGPKP